MGDGGMPISDRVREASSVRLPFELDVLTGQLAEIHRYRQQHGFEFKQSSSKIFEGKTNISKHNEICRVYFKFLDLRGVVVISYCPLRPSLIWEQIYEESMYLNNLWWCFNAWLSLWHEYLVRCKIFKVQFLCPII